MNTKYRAFFKAQTACLIAVLAFISVRAGTTYTWSLPGGRWDVTSGNFGGAAWVDDEAAPNSATFATSEATAGGARVSVEVAGEKHVDVLSVGGGAPGYDFQGDAINVKTKLNVWTTARFTNIVRPYGDGTLWITGSKMLYLLGGAGAFTGGIKHDLSNFIVLDQDYQLGSEPDTERDNIWVTAQTAGIFAQGSFSIHSNRTMRISATKGIRLGAGNNQTLRVRGLVTADDSPGCDGYVTNTVLTVYDGWKGWGGLTMLDPGDGRTNKVGNIVMNGHLKVASGVTRLGTPKWATGDGALMHVKNVKDNPSFNATWGHLEIDGGEIYSSQSGRIVDVNTYGQVTVKNGGKVNLPNSEWINGLSSPARLTVDRGGEFNVNYLRLTQSDAASEIYLNEGGTISAKRLYIDSAGRACNFIVNGGTLKAASVDNKKKDFPLTYNYTSDVWAGTTFKVGEKGARFDVSNGNYIWWGRPLVSAAEGDGGLTATGAGDGAYVILLAANSYAGPTRVDGCNLSARVDNAIPEGSRLVLANGAKVYCYSEDDGRATIQRLSTVEGAGEIYNTANLTVSGAIEPSAGGVIAFRDACRLGGTLKISCDAENGCGMLMLKDSSGNIPDISGLTLSVDDFSVFDKETARSVGYKILDAPNGYSGSFSLPEGWNDDWFVKYGDDGAWLRNKRGLFIILK